ncbi:phage tail protein [Aeromonas salmonicida]|uniref:phage tail-collar fiber domain-containing protein n=1 Tax=Aeromonas salmonicida TaxID=645 RepID=UPI00232BCD8A|nr:phage tail protein [Aeromonas salmonicida]WCH28728.1 phage tail protein [Aeromonas salmonicida]
MSQIITNAFANYLQACLATQVPVVLDEFVLANIPGLDPSKPISPDQGLPPAGQIVHRRAVDQRGRINNDAVAYTIVMDTTVGDFSFNALYLINKASGVVGMIVHKGLETKLKTHEATGQTGNSLVKSMLMEYDRAPDATATHVDASTWQIDYAARLRGMDDDLRLQALQFFGPATFYGNGFNLVNESGVYKVQPGVAYVGGLRAQLNEVKKVTPGAKPVGLWLDIYRAGSLLDAWVNHFTLTLSVPDLVDYRDTNGHQHHVAKVAIINANGSVTDVRRKRTIELTGDVTGKGILEDAQGVTIAVEIKNGSHRHQWGELDQVPATASRWPSWAEVTSKPDLAAANHTHPGSWLLAQSHQLEHGGPRHPQRAQGVCPACQRQHLGRPPLPGEQRRGADCQQWRRSPADLSGLQLEPGLAPGPIQHRCLDSLDPGLQHRQQAHAGRAGGRSGQSRPPLGPDKRGTSANHPLAHLGRGQQQARHHATGGAHTSLGASDRGAGHGHPLASLGRSHRQAGHHAANRAHPHRRPGQRRCGGQGRGPNRDLRFFLHPALWRLCPGPNPPRQQPALVFH